MVPGTYLVPDLDHRLGNAYIKGHPHLSISRLTSSSTLTLCFFSSIPASITHNIPSSTAASTFQPLILESTIAQRSLQLHPHPHANLPLKMPFSHYPVGLNPLPGTDYPGIIHLDPFQPANEGFTQKPMVTPGFLSEVQRHQADIYSPQGHDALHALMRETRFGSSQDAVAATVGRPAMMNTPTIEGLSKILSFLCHGALSCWCSSTFWGGEELASTS